MHVRDVGLTTGGWIDSGRGSARAPRAQVRSRRPLLHPIRTLWRRLLRRGLFQQETRIGRLTAELHTPFDAFERASDSVARGNLKVFEEIGHEFARYLQECPPDDPDALQRFLDGLRPGDPPDGQRYLREAFERYERRQLESDPKARMELAVLANLAIGFHEQTRLQPQIREALDAGYATKEDLGRRVLDALFPSAVRLWPVVRRPAAAVVGVIAAGAQRGTSRLAREVITESLMVLALPGRVLGLGMHLGDTYPEPLREPADARADRVPGAVRAGPAGARSVRSARLVGPPPADALHRAPVLRVSPARRALPSSLHAGAGCELQQRRRAGRRAVTESSWRGRSSVAPRQSSSCSTRRLL